MKTAVVLFNLGGPDNLKAVRPFLFNLFNDHAIIRVPQPFRWFIARMISGGRAKKARGIYQQMGGKSPILDFTLAQADALEAQLKKKGDYKVFVCMRYWHPRSNTVAKNVKAYNPDHVILLPLYPQYSTTTTGSSFADWEKQAKEAGLEAPQSRICCYPVDRTFITAHIKKFKDTYWKAAETAQPRVLFSAHGLPEKIVKGGDPYQWQVEKTVASVVQIMAIDDLDYSICYQSRVGPMKWIGPSTEEEILRAGKDNVPIVVVPISFVSEHSETLVELDIDYRKLAEANNVPGYWRVPSLGTESLFIETLADLCKMANDAKTQAFNKQRFCPDEFKACACQIAKEQDVA